MGTRALPLNWHFVWLLHDMQSAMLIHDAFHAPERVHYTDAQREQVLLQERSGERREAPTDEMASAASASVPAINTKTPRASEQCEVLASIREESTDLPQISRSASQSEALPQRQ